MSLMILTNFSFDYVVCEQLQYVASVLNNANTEFELSLPIASKCRVVPSSSPDSSEKAAITLAAADLVPTALLKFRPLGLSGFTGVRQEYVTLCEPLTSIPFPTKGWCNFPFLNLVETVYHYKSMILFPSNIFCYPEGDHTHSFLKPMLMWPGDNNQPWSFFSNDIILATWWMVSWDVCNSSLLPFSALCHTWRHTILSWLKVAHMLPGAQNFTRFFSSL
jgi:hypothetical protein